MDKNAPCRELVQRAHRPLPVDWHVPHSAASFLTGADADQRAIEQYDVAAREASRIASVTAAAPGTNTNRARSRCSSMPTLAALRRQSNYHTRRQADGAQPSLGSVLIGLGEALISVQQPSPAKTAIPVWLRRLTRESPAHANASRTRGVDVRHHVLVMPGGHKRASHKSHGYIR